MLKESAPHLFTPHLIDPGLKGGPLPVDCRNPFCFSLILNAAALLSVTTTLLLLARNTDHALLIWGDTARHCSRFLTRPFGVRSGCYRFVCRLFATSPMQKPL